MTREARIYLRIDSGLKRRAQEYCDRKHTTMSELVTRFLVRLLEEERKKKVSDAEQI